jgi:hypothetical protein
MTFGKGVKYVLIFLLIFIVLSLLGVACNIISLPFFAANKAIDGTKTVISRTLDGNNILFNYENFKDMFEGAKQQVANMNKAKLSQKDVKTTYGEDAKQWPKDVRDQYSFLQQNIDGYNMQYQSIVARYNADSKKLNRNLFKDKALPYELPLDPDQLEAQFQLQTK